MPEMIVFKWMSLENGPHWDLLLNIEQIMLAGTCQEVISIVSCHPKIYYYLDGTLMLMGGDYDEQSTEVFNSELGSGIC